MGLGTLTMLGMLWAPGQAAPSDLYPFNTAKMDIPIRYDPAKKNEIREMLLYVSRNQGESWDQYGVANPERDSIFAFTAPVDGIYWFQMMIVDKQGRRDPADLKKAPVGLKVLIDTKSPVVAIKSVERQGDEATVAWDVQEANPDWGRFALEYRIGEGTWQPMDVKGTPFGSARFRINQTGPVTVRLQAWDVAGNHSEASKDVAAPVNVAVAPKENVQQSSLRISPPPDVPPPTTTDMGLPILPPVDSPITRMPEKTAPIAPPVSTDPLAVSNQSYTGPTGGQLPNAQIINVARFDVAYDVEQKGPSGISKAEVWVTRDEGKAWQKWSTTEKTESPITVDLATRNNPQVEGNYGLKIVLLSGAGLSKGPPISGDVPDMRVDVDLTPPVVKIYEPLPDPNQKDTMVLRWQAVDRNLASDPITLEWADQPDGPWHPIVGIDNGAPLGSSSVVAARRLPNSGQHSWRLPANFPTHRVYLRVMARDVAGNVAEAKTPHPILVDTNKPVARIQGIIGAAAPERK